MKMNNNLLDKDVWNPIDNSQLSYNKNIEIGRSVSKTTDKHFPRNIQYISKIRHRPLRTYSNYKMRMLPIITLT